MALSGKRTVFSLIIIYAGTVLSVNAPVVPEAAAQGSAEADSKIEYKSAGLRDPFEQEVVEPEGPVEIKPLPLLEVQGMVWGGNLPQAIINNKVLKVGDTIEGVRIASIDKSGIIVFFENQQYTLSIINKAGSDGI